MQLVFSVVDQKIFLKRKSVLFWLLICLFQYSNGQIGGTGVGNNGNFSDAKIVTDTSRKIQTLTDDRISIYYTTRTDSTHAKPDTSIGSIHQNPLWQMGLLNLGNEYSPANVTIYRPLVSSIQPHLGFTSFQYILWKATDAKLYNTTRPYTELFYTIGAKQEQQLQLTHTQNILPNWNISAQYRKMSSPGFYRLQKNNVDNVQLNTHYSSPNQQYQLSFTLVYNKVQQDENGGLQDEEDLKQDIYSDRRLIPVRYEADNAQRNKSSVSNYYREIELLLTHKYAIGKKDSVWNADSTEKNYRFRPRFSLNHTMQYSNQYHRYKDLQPDSIDYNSIALLSFQFPDSFHTRYFLARYSNVLSLAGYLNIGKHTMAAEAGIGIDYDIVQSHLFRKNYLNNFLFATLKKEAKADTRWWLYAAFRNYFSGYALGNTSLDATLGIKLPRQINAYLRLNQMIQSPTYMQQYWGNEFIIQQNSFSKISVTQVKASAQSNEQTWQLSADYYMIANHIYRDTLAALRQYNKVIPIAQLHGTLNKKLGAWRISPSVTFQYVSENTPIHLPLLISNTQIAYERALFNKKLLISTGVDVYFHSPFKADVYMPVFNGFATQYTRRISNIPSLAAFFNFKVKSYRAFITAGQIQQLFANNNILYPNYASPNLGLRFGFYWGFVN